MTRSRTPRELRERMERVAAKPTLTPSGADVARPGARRTPESRAAEPRSRLETLAAWGKWELTVVPARRWRWLRAVIRPGNSPTDDRRRGD
jgi:hypothetical protein